MYRLLIIIGVSLVISNVRSQNYMPDIVEDSLFQMFERFRYMKNTAARQELNVGILEYIQDQLVREESFQFRFDSLRKRAGILDAGDNSLRVFTWNIPLSAWEHEYHGILQVHDEQTHSCRIHVLRHRTGKIQDLGTTVTGAEEWPGALYYDIRRNKKGGEVFYTLMGFNFNDRWSDIKIIDVLYFDGEANPRFGKPVFNTPEGIRHRVVFEFSGEVAMNLRYNPDLKMIVYDHLAPIEPELKGHPRFYAPDFTYDGYKFRRGIWEHRSEVDVRNR